MIDLSNENVIHTKKEKVEYIQFRRLLLDTELVHAYTLSQKGFDVGGNKTCDNLESYQRIAEGLAIPYQNIVRPYQIHTDVIKVIEERPKNRNIAIFSEELKAVDGLITNQKDILLSLSYADCIALLFWDPIKRVIGNIHSGWKGTLQRIGTKAIQKMIERYECNVQDIICCMGPSIHVCHFEVDKELADTFYQGFKKLPKIESSIKKGRIIQNKQKYNIDTIEINRQVLQQIGLKPENIIDSGLCTVCHQEQFHSYRAQKEKSGRNTAIMGLK